MDDPAPPDPPPDPATDRPLEQLPAGKAVGVHLRRYRREHAMSQRALAARLGWAQPTLSRAERDASMLRLERVEELLEHTGARLAIVPIVRSRD